MVILTKKNAILACLIGLIVLLGLAAMPHTATAAYSELDSYTSYDFVHAVSDDERYVVYAKEGESATEIYWLDLQTGEKRLLTIRPYAYNIFSLKFRIAPNNDYIFVQHQRSDGNSLALSRVQVSNGQVTPLFGGYKKINLAEARFSVNGQRVVFVAYGFDQPLQLFNHTLSTTVVTSLPLPLDVIDIPQFDLHPDSKTIVMHAINNRGQHGVYHTSATGGAVVPLHPYSAWRIESLALSPDGETAYYFVRRNNNDVRLTRSRLSDPTPTTIGSAGMVHGSLQFSPDGRYAFYPQRVANQGSVFRLTLADDSLIVLHSDNILFADDEHLGITVPSVGNRVVIAEANNGNDDRSIRILSVAYDPPAPAQELTPRYGVNTFASKRLPFLITPDAQTVIFPEPAESAFYLNQVAMDGTTPAQRLYPNPVVEEVRLSPSGLGVFAEIGTTEPVLLPAKLYYIGLADAMPQLLYRAPTAPPLGLTLQSTPAPEVVFFTVIANAGFPNSSVTLLRADLSPAAQFTVPENATLPEGVTRTVTVELMPSSTTTETVSYEVISGTATLDDDFTLSPPVLVFAPGQVSQTLTVTALSDVAAEGLESATLQLTGTATSTLSTMTLSFNELVVISQAAPAHLAATSEDGRYVIYQEEHATEVGLYSYDMLTGVRITLQLPTSDLRLDDAAFLSPDTQTVLYESDTGIRQVPRTGGTVLNLGTVDCPATVIFSATAPTALVWSDCRSTNSASPLYRIDLTNAAVTLVMPDIPPPAVIAHDGNATVFASWESAPEGTSYMVPTRFGSPQMIEGGLQAAFFPTPTTALLVRRSGIATLLDITDALATDLIDLETDMPATLATFVYSPRRDSLYYTTQRDLRRYRLAATTIEVLGGNADITLGLTANEEQLLVISPGIVKTISVFTGEQIWRSASVAGRLAVRPDRRGVVYSAPTRPETLAPLYYKDLYSNAPDRLLPLMMTADDADLFRVGDASVYALVGTTLQSTRLNVAGPAVTHFRDALPPTLTRLVGEDVLFFNDAQGNMYAIADPAPRVAFATSPDILAAEGETVTITLSLESTPLTTATVSIEVIGGTATSGTDVNAPPATLTFAPFQREVSFPLTLAADGSSEPVETLELRVTPLSGASLGDLSTFRLRLADTLYRRYFPTAQRSR